MPHNCEADGCRKKCLIVMYMTYKWQHIEGLSSMRQDTWTVIQTNKLFSQKELTSLKVKRKKSIYNHYLPLLIHETKLLLFIPSYMGLDSSWALFLKEECLFWTKQCFPLS
jgi:hypothetical protein